MGHRDNERTRKLLDECEKLRNQIGELQRKLRETQEDLDFEKHSASCHFCDAMDASMQLEEAEEKARRAVEHEEFTSKKLAEANLALDKTRKALAVSRGETWQALREVRKYARHAAELSKRISIRADVLIEG